MQRLLTILIACVLAASTARAAPQTEATDASRSILLVVVKTTDQRAQIDVDAWIQAFKNGIGYLLYDFSSTKSSKGPVIKVQVVTEKVNEIDQDGLETRFGLQPSLQVLSTVAHRAAQSTVVDNNIYLGEFKGSLPQPFVYISREITPEEYKINRQALSAVTLYAYAMAVTKTLPGNDNRYIVCRILEQANKYKNDFGAELRDYLSNLFRALSDELDARACGGKK